MCELALMIMKELEDGIKVLESKDLSSAANVLRNRLADYERSMQFAGHGETDADLRKLLTPPDER